ncbi:MAG: extracellular solute-binding protein [Caldilineaceae bacterium]
MSLKFWMWNTYAPAADDILEQGILAWAAENGMDVEISRDSDSDIAGKVMPALEAGTLPDALFAGSGDALRIMDAGGAAPLNDLWPLIGDAHGGWMPRLDQYVTRDGVIGFLPYSIDTPMVHYRQDIFDAAGIAVPEGQWTWDEVRDLCMQAQQYTEEQGDKKVGWGFGVVKQQHDGWCEDIFRNFGADIWDESGQNIILKDQSSEAAVRALTFAKEGWDMGLFPADAASWDWSSNNKSYQEEQSIFVINSASVYTWAQANKPELVEVTGLAPGPKDARHTTNAGLRYTVVMYKETKNAEAGQLIQGPYTPEIHGLVAGERLCHQRGARVRQPAHVGRQARFQFNLAANIGAPFTVATLPRTTTPPWPN